jgi:hypothetical protein
MQSVFAPTWMVGLAAEIPSGNPVFTGANNPRGKLPRTTTLSCLEASSTGILAYFKPNFRVEICPAFRRRATIIASSLPLASSRHDHTRRHPFVGRRRPSIDDFVE